MAKKDWGLPTRSSARLANRAAPAAPSLPPARTRAPRNTKKKEKTAPKKSAGTKRPNRGKPAPTGNNIPNTRSPARPSGVSKTRRLRLHGPRSETERDALAGAAAARNGAIPPPAIRSAPASQEGSPSANDGEETLHQLAHITQEFEAQLGGRDEVKESRTIRAELYVYSSPPMATSLLPYSAVFFLEPLDHNAGEYVRVGTIKANRIDKKTAFAPDAEGKSLRQFLRPNLKKYDEGTSLKEVAVSLRAVFKNTGQARDTEQFHDELNDKSLLFIQLVHTEPQFQRKGLLRPMLQCFRRMLQQLSEWFVFRDLIILSPGAPSDKAGEVWNGKEAEEVSEILRGVYERADDYRWMRESTVGEAGIPIMGRMVRDEDMSDVPVHHDDVDDWDNGAGSPAADGGAEDGNEDP